MYLHLYLIWYLCKTCTPHEVELQSTTKPRLYWLEYWFTSQSDSSGGKLITCIYLFLFCRGGRREYTSEEGEIRKSEQKTSVRENTFCQILKN